MNSEQILNEFLTCHTAPLDKARTWHMRHKGKVIAHLLPDVPEEIIHAAGALPLALTGRDQKTSLADSQIPSFICPLLRNPFEMALRGELDFIDGMVIPYVCDSTRAFSHVWEAKFPDLFNHVLWLPKKCDGVSAKAFLFSEFSRLKERLEVFVGREITAHDLRQSIGVYNQNRKLLREVYRLREKGQIPITYANFLAVVKASMIMAKTDHNALLSALVDDLREQHEPRGKEAPVRVSLFGTVGEPYPVLSLFDQIGLNVVDDSLYNGTRYFLQDVDPSAAPMEGLVNRHLSKDPLSVFHTPRDRWRAYLRRRITENQIEGVIYFPSTYCDPLEFDYPFFKELIGETEIPVLLLETDLQSGSLEQMRTRLEAFAEMVRERKDDTHRS
jgi:benzoyl-CoA reductase subunit C